MLRKLALALVAPLLVTGACAQEADGTQVLTGATGVAALRAAPDAATDAGSARFEMTVAFDSPDGSFEIVSTGAYRGDQLAMEMDLGAALAGLGDLGDEPIPEGFDEPMQIVVDGTTAYLRIPMLQALTGTSGWLSATPEELAAAGGSLGVTGGTGDPSQLLDTLRGVAGAVDEVGPDEVRGVATTRYRATVDLADAIERAPEVQREEMQAMLDQLGADVTSIPVDVWVDADGLARRLVMDFGDLAAQVMGVDGSATLTLELFDYGEDVTIEIPDPSEVTPIGGLLGAFGGQG
jgi:hypothetical protein